MAPRAAGAARPQSSRSRSANVGASRSGRIGGSRRANRQHRRIDRGRGRNESLPIDPPSSNSHHGAHPAVRSATGGVAACLRATSAWSTRSDRNGPRSGRSSNMANSSVVSPNGGFATTRYGSLGNRRRRTSVSMIRHAIRCVERVDERPQPIGPDEIAFDRPQTHAGLDERTRQHSRPRLRSRRRVRRHAGRGGRRSVRSAADQRGSSDRTNDAAGPVRSCAARTRTVTIIIMTSTVATPRRASRASCRRSTTIDIGRTVDAWNRARSTTSSRRPSTRETSRVGRPLRTRRLVLQSRRTGAGPRCDPRGLEGDHGHGARTDHHDDRLRPRAGRHRHDQQPLVDVRRRRR